MNSRLIIIGAGGHGRVIADIALKNGYKNIFFVDDFAKGECMDFPIVGTVDKTQELNDGKTDFVVAVGDNKVREDIACRFNVSWATLIHPSAQIGTNVTVGEGTVVMANAVINPGVVIGNHCIINSASVVEHDCKISSFVHISVRAALGGTVEIGKSTFVGIGAAVKNNISICSDCVIGAGAVVVRNIESSGVYVGVPAGRLL